MTMTWYIVLCLCECISGLLADTGDILSAGETVGVSIGVFVAVFCIIEFIRCNWERIQRLCSKCCCCCGVDAADCRETNVQLPIRSICTADPDNLEDRIRYGLGRDEQRPVTPRSILPYEAREMNPSDLPPSYDEVMANKHLVQSAPPSTPAPHLIPWTPKERASPSAPPLYAYR